MAGTVRSSAIPPEAQGAIDRIDEISPLQVSGHWFDETQGGRCGALPLRSALGWSVTACQALRSPSDTTNRLLTGRPALNQREVPEEGRLAIIAGGTESNANVCNANRGFA